MEVLIKVRAKVNTKESDLMLRDGPNGASKGAILKGTIVEVLEFRDDWSNVRWRRDPGFYLDGWVSTQYLSFPDGMPTGNVPTAAHSSGKPKKVKVNTSGSPAHLRKTASASGAPIKQIPDGTALDVLETATGWMKVRYVAPDGTAHEGWCKSDLLSIL